MGYYVSQQCQYALASLESNASTRFQEMRFGEILSDFDNVFIGRKITNFEEGHISHSLTAFLCIFIWYQQAATFPMF
jgi:hypothetical protein